MVNFDVEKPSGKEFTQLAGKSTIFFSGCISEVGFWWISLLARVSLLGGKTCQPPHNFCSQPQPHGSHHNTSALHISKPPRKLKPPRIGKVTYGPHDVLRSTDVVFFFWEKLVFFDQKNGGNPEDSQTIKTYGPCVKEFFGQHMKSGRASGCNIRSCWFECQLHGICRISTNSDFHQILWRDIGVSIHNRTTAVKLSLSPDYGVHRDLVARLGPTTASASATFQEKHSWKLRRHWKITENLHPQYWVVVSTHLKDISLTGSFPQGGVKIENIWNHQLE